MKSMPGWMMTMLMALSLALLPTRSGSALTASESAAGSGTASDASSELDRVMALLSQRRHGEAQFHERKYLATLKRPLESSGVLLYQAPDHLEQQITSPQPMSVILDHGMLTIEKGKHRRVLRLTDYPQLAPLIDSIRATLAGDRAALEQAFQLGFTGTVDHWQLQLEPRTTSLGINLKRIDIRGERDAVHEVQLLQTDGGRSIMSITPSE